MGELYDEFLRCVGALPEHGVVANQGRVEDGKLRLIAVFLDPRDADVYRDLIALLPKIAGVLAADREALGELQSRCDELSGLLESSFAAAVVVQERGEELHARASALVEALEEIEADA